jgi:hypothetical protein
VASAEPEHEDAEPEASEALVEIARHATISSLPTTKTSWFRVPSAEAAFEESGEHPSQTGDEPDGSSPRPTNPRSE